MIKTKTKCLSASGKIYSEWFMKFSLITEIAATVIKVIWGFLWSTFRTNLEFLSFPTRATTISCATRFYCDCDEMKLNIKTEKQIIEIRYKAIIKFISL